MAENKGNGPDVPALHTAMSFQQVTHVEFHILEVLGIELAVLTLEAWVETFRCRLSRWQRQQQQLLLDVLAVPPTILADCAHHIVEAHVRNFPIQ